MICAITTYCRRAYDGCVMQVLQVKAVIEETNPEFPAAQLKLIHSGQILKDDSTLAEYKIKEDEFLVCMVTKVRRRSVERNAYYGHAHGCDARLPQRWWHDEAVGRWNLPKNMSHTHTKQPLFFFLFHLLYTGCAVRVPQRTYVTLM